MVSCCKCLYIILDRMPILLNRLGPSPRYISCWHIIPELFQLTSFQGNLLIRSAPSSSLSPYNFEIVLLDHGLYFDLTEELRFNYAKLWLALIDSASPTTIAERRKYANLVGNIGSDLVGLIYLSTKRRNHLRWCWVIVSYLRSCYYWPDGAER